MSLRVWLAGSFALGTGIAACAPLPVLEAGVCGNGVIEANEDCDEPNGDGVSCGLRSAADPKTACRFVCSPSAADANAACEGHGAGYRCGSDGICRRPSGTYVRATPVEIGRRIAVEAGDFDGDGATDVAAMSEAGELDVLYSARVPSPQGAYATTALRPTVGALNADRKDDLAHVAGDGVGVLLGQSDRTLLPVSFAPFPGIGVGHVLLTKGKQPPLCALGSVNCPPDLEVSTYALDDLLVVLNLEEGATDLVDPIAVAVHQDANERIYSAPFGYPNLGLHDGGVVTGRMSATHACDSVVLPSLGTNEVYVQPLCDEPDSHSWTSLFLGPAVTLPNVPGLSPSHVAFGALAADFDGNGALDLLIGSDVATSSQGGTSYRLFVAFNDGTGQFWSGPSNAKGAPPKGELGVAGDTGIDLRFDPSRGDADGLPLAAGDLDGDGRADLVLRAAAFSLGGENNDGNVVAHSVLALSADGTPGATVDLVGRPETGLAFHLVDLAPGTLQAARIGDFNADGRPDVAAIVSESKSVMLFQGNGAGVFNRLQVATQGVPQQLAVGDFDGDFVADIAIAEDAPGATSPARSGCPTQPKRMADSDGKDLTVPYRPHHHGTSVSVLYGRPLALPESPLRLGEFRCIEHLTVGDVGRYGIDGRQELLVLGDDALGIRSVAAFSGAGSRQLESAYAVSALPEDDFIGIKTGALADGYEPLQAVVVPPRDPNSSAFVIATLLIPTADDGFDVPNAKLAFVQGVSKSVPQLQGTPLAADPPPLYAPNGDNNFVVTAGYPCAQTLVPYAGGVLLVDFDAPDTTVNGLPVNPHQLRLTQFSEASVKDPLMKAAFPAVVPVARIGGSDLPIESFAGNDSDDATSVTVADLAAYRRCLQRSPSKTETIFLSARATVRSGFVAGDPAKEDLLVLFHQPAALSPGEGKPAVSRFVVFVDEDLAHGIVIDGSRLLEGRAPVTFGVVPGPSDRPTDLVFTDGLDVVVGHLDALDLADSASARVRTTALVSGGQGATDSNASGTSAERAWDDAIVVGDFDGDGVVEFAALQGGALTVFHGNGEVP